MEIPGNFIKSTLTQAFSDSFVKNLTNNIIFINELPKVNYKFLT